MTPRRILLFFKKLDMALGQPADIILIGASAGALMGHIRPSVDIDFEIRFKGKQAVLKPAMIRLQQVIEATAQSVGVAVNYSENIGRWSMISYLDYRKTAVFFRKIGKLNVKLIAPEYWTIGKMARFLELDLRDMLKIIRRKKIPPETIIRIWAAAAQASDLSLELGQFRTHVLYFLKHHTRRLWGKKESPEKWSQRFLDALDST